MPFLIVAGVLLLLALVYLLLLSPGPKRNTAPFSRTKFAHRGLHTGDGRVPENSLAAFRRAREAGWGVELDVQFTADRQVVVFHDATLQRMCGVEQRVDALTYDQLQELTLLDSDQSIPLLTEALAQLEGVSIVCEFKSYGSVTDVSLCEAAFPLLQTHRGPWCMESFNPFQVRWFRQHQPQVVRGLLAKRYGKQDGIPLWQRWLLGSLAANGLCRPDFIAFDHHGAASPAFRLCRALFRPLCIAWTLHSAAEEQQTTRVFDTVIFEGYTPEP